MSQTTKCSSWQWPLKNVVGLCVAVLSWLGISSAVAQSAGVNFPNGSYSAEVTDLRVLSAAGPVEWTRNYNGKGWRFNRHWDGISASYKPMMTQNTGGGSPGASGAGGATCWIWVDEDWQPADTDSGSTPGVNSPLSADSYLPPNRGYSQTAVPLERNVSTGFTSGCGSVGGNLVSNSSEILEGYRRLSSLYVGASGSYIFKNRYILKKQPIQKLPAGTSANGGSVSLVDLETSPHGWRWSDRAGDWAEYDDQGRMTRYGDKNNNTIWLQRDAQGRIAGIVDGGTGGNATSGQLLISLHYDAKGYLVEAKDWPRSGNSLDLPQRSVRYSYDSLGHLSAVTDVRGHTTRYAYDGKARLVKTVDPRGGETVLTYEQEGNTVTSLKAADGSVTNYTSSWDDAKKLFYSKEIGPQTAAGRREELYSHDRAGDLVKVEINGRTELEVKRDPAMRTQTRTNARGFATSYTQNEYEQTTQIVYPNGAKFSVAYDARLLQPVEEMDELGIKTRYEYDSKGNLLTVTEAVGLPEQRITEYVRDEAGRPQRITRKGRTEVNGTVTADATWHMTYDAAGNLAETTDPEGARRSYVYNRLGHLVRYTDPLGHATHYETDAAGKLIKTTDALNRVRSYLRDPLGNVTLATDARGQQIQASYDALNRRLNLINPVGGIHKLQYNPQGLPVSETDEDGRTSQAEFDNFLRITKEIDGLGHVTQYSYHLPDGSNTGGVGALFDPTETRYPTFTQRLRYDPLERPTSQTLENPGSLGTEGLVSSNTYDLRGQVLTETDANGKTHSYQYDALGRLIAATDSLGNTTQAQYDARGNLIQITDANGNVNQFVFDRNSRVTREILPLGQVTAYQYDAAGNLTHKVDANGHTTQYRFDGGNRLLEVKHTHASGALMRTSSYTWDAEDHLTAWRDTDHSRSQTSSAALDYDAAGRKTQETLTYPDGHTLGYQYSYSAAAYKTRLTWADGTAIDYSYSAHGELQTVAIPNEGSISVAEYKWLEPSKITLPGGSTQTRTLDGLLYLEDLKVKTPGQQTILNIANTWGKVQELKAQTRSDTAGGISSSKNSSFGYDDEIRLTQVQTDVGGLFGSDTERYTLDALGNRIAHSKVSGAWIYDANNRLTQIGNGSCGQSGVTCYQYDAAGNLTEKQTADRILQYHYDTQNRLTQVQESNGSLIARYGYDPLDRRIWKEEFRDKDGKLLAQAQRTHYLYADEGLIAEATQAITLHQDGSTSSNAAPQISTQYGLRPNSEWGTGPLFIKTINSNGQDSFAYYHHDQLQTPVQATDKAGNIVWAASYTAFGKASITTPQATVERPTIRSNLRLPGQYEDGETGLHYNYRRYYDGGIGRYISQDPMGLDGGMNQYQYANGDPINLSDPTGECPQCAAFALCMATCAVTTAAENAITGECNNWGSTAKNCAIGCAAGMGLGWIAGKATGWVAGWWNKRGALQKAQGAVCEINSFPADTVVHIKPEEGSSIDAQQAKTVLKPISQLQVGDEVLTIAEWKDKGENPTLDQRLSYEKVVDIFTSFKEQTLVHLSLANGKQLTATEGHPFKTLEGWRDAVMLKKGGKLLLKGGDADSELAVEITEIRTERKTLPVYNIEVANAHTYFVGEDGVGVHNCSRGAGVEFTKKIKEANYAKNKNCVYCDKETIRTKKPHPDRYNADHKTSVKDGGKGDATNVQTTCQTCNLEKGGMSDSAYRAKKGG